jgi:hypothetical protein
LNQHVEDLALVVDGTPEIRLARDARRSGRHVVKMRGSSRRCNNPLG